MLGFPGQTEPAQATNVFELYLMKNNTSYKKIVNPLLTVILSFSESIL